MFHYFITEKNNEEGVARRFTGINAEYYYCFPTWGKDCNCATRSTADKVYRSYPVVCKDCANFIKCGEFVAQHIGLPEKQVQRLEAEWIHEEFFPPQKISSAAAVPGTDQFVALIDEPRKYFIPYIITHVIKMTGVNKTFHG